MRDKVKEAYERACVEGRFEADSYIPGMLHEPNPNEPKAHLVQFMAYDGYHVFHYFRTRKQADKAVVKVNAMGSVKAVTAYRDGLRKDVKLLEER